MKKQLPVINLTEGEEVRIVKGVQLYAKPKKVTVHKVYPYHILLLMEFKNYSRHKDKKNIIIKTSVNRAALFCGDAILIRKHGGNVIGCYTGGKRHAE